MVKKHITRDYSSHKHSVIRPSDEYIRFECYSYDPSFTKTYSVQQKNIKTTQNTTKTSWNSLSCYRSKDLQNPMQISIPLNIKETGEYRIDILYEKSDYLCKTADKNAKTDTSKDLTGEVGVTPTGNIARASTGKAKKSDIIDVFNKVKTVKKDNTVLFDGENNYLKRKTLYRNLGISTYSVVMNIPHNCYFYAVIIRKIKKYWGDNLGSAGSNLQFTDADLTISDMVSPSELQVTVGYDDSFEYLNSPSGFYMDYYDECNLVVHDKKGDDKIIFGGYLTSILPNDNRTQLSIYCANRSIDGQNRYILDELVLNKGTSDLKTNEYNSNSERSFDSYPKLLKYLCKIFETSFKNNITKKYLVDGEKYHKGKIIQFKNKKVQKQLSASNGELTKEKKYITLRNKSSGKKKQVWNLYDASKLSSKPANITSYPYMHLTYGLGEVKKEDSKKTVESVDNVVAGSQKFSKCGVSKDKKYVMGIGKRGVGKGKGTYSYKNYYKSIFINKCPYCKKEGTLRWDSARTDTKCIYTARWNGTKRNWGGGIPETEITCNSCDCDFDVPTGYSKEGKYKYKLKKASTTVQSSKAEQDKLHKGEIEAVGSKKVQVSSDEVFKAITKVAFKYKYLRGATGQTYAQMKKTGHGDCWGFSDLISKELSKYKVNHKIVQYSTGSSKVHRSVLYQNKKGKYVDFPYREYGWNTKYNNMLNNTSGSKSGKIIFHFKKGGGINQAKYSGSSTASQTTTVTTITGYNKDAPFQAYIKLTYSLKQDFKAKTYNFYIDWTQSAKSNYKITGLGSYWINNATRKVTTGNIIERLKLRHGENKKFYLHSIQMIAPAIKATDEQSNTDWYTFDKSTKDYASNKVDLYQIVFNDKSDPNPSELSSCGKSINSLLSEVVDEAGYLVDITYSTHRCNDVINFRVNSDTKVSFIATEGDDNNILRWNSISYTPVSTLFNRSVCVFKGKDELYNYVDTRYLDSILKYGEQTTLQTSTEMIGSNEAYYNAVNSDSFNPEQTYSFTITVSDFPNVKLGQLCQVIANAKKLNTVKTINSIKLNYSKSNIPRLRTELGLDELAPDIQLKKDLRKLRQTTKTNKTWFGRTATPVTDPEVYEWDN